MKRILEVSIAGIVCVILTFLLMSLGGSQKIAFVDLNEIIAKSDAGKDASAKLQGFIEIKEAEVQEKRDNLVGLQEMFKKTMNELPENKVEEKKEQIIQKSREFELFVNNVRQEIQTKNKSYSEKLVPEIRKIVRGIGYRQGYAMIMDINSGNIIYHSQGTNITDSALQEFNEEYNIGALDFNDAFQK